MRQSTLVSRALIVATAALLSACTTDPTGTPAADSIVSASLSKENAAALNAQLKNEQKRVARAAGLSHALFDSLHAVWKAAHKGLGPLQLVGCEPMEYAAQVKIIGPEGGTLQAGRQQLVIPRDALDAPTVITLEAPVAATDLALLSPRGLTFRTPASLRMSYDHCVLPQLPLPMLVVWLDAQLGALPLVMPSHDTRGQQAVTAQLPHFSQYAVAF